MRGARVWKSTQIIRIANNRLANNRIFFVLTHKNSLKTISTRLYNTGEYLNTYNSPQSKFNPQYLPQPKHNANAKSWGCILSSFSQ